MITVYALVPRSGYTVKSFDTHHAATSLAFPIPPIIIESRRSRMVAMSAAVPGSDDCVGWLTGPVTVKLEDVTDGAAVEPGMEVPDMDSDGAVDVVDPVALELATEEYRMDDAVCEKVADAFPEVVRFGLGAPLETETSREVVVARAELVSLETDSPSCEEPVNAAP